FEASLVGAGTVMVTAYSGLNLVDHKAVRLQANQGQTVAFGGAGIDRTVFKAPVGGVGLPAFAYAVIAGSPVELQDYPYIMDFEPKKRELYEAVTQTGESVSQSASNLNVRKGATDTSSQENYNISHGSQGGGSLDVLGIVKVGGSGGVQGQ